MSTSLHSDRNLLQFSKLSPERAQALSARQLPFTSVMAAIFLSVLGIDG